MLDLILITLMALAIGAIVWGVDKRHNIYGSFLPAGVAVTAAMLCWIITVLFGLSYQPGLTWIPWVLPLVVAAGAAVAVSTVLGARRVQRHTAALTEILKR
ncbi:MAG: hypothetical protein HIU81_13380 [Acidobacteria bacterium]|nr:hypothetical protein [Acidobacteriota bacterium]